jgi:hypothetical protein
MAAPQRASRRFQIPKTSSEQTLASALVDARLILIFRILNTLLQIVRILWIVVLRFA